MHVPKNNRRAERERTKKQASAFAKQKYNCGLLEPAESANADEKIAYQNLRCADNGHVAWVIKQNVGEDSEFYQETKSPYFIACNMLDKARAVATLPTWQNVAAFLQAWRENEFAVPERSTAVMSSQTTQPRGSGPRHALHRAYHISCVAEARLATAIIEYRWAMAFLGREYHAEIQTLDDDRRHARTPVIDRLWVEMVPNGTKTQRKRFVKRLAVATRWYQTAETLGWGSLRLLPDSVSKKWANDCLAHLWLL